MAIKSSRVPIIVHTGAHIQTYPDWVHNLLICTLQSHSCIEIRYLLGSCIYTNCTILSNYHSQTFKQSLSRQVDRWRPVGQPKNSCRIRITKMCIKRALLKRTLTSWLASWTFKKLLVCFIFLESSKRYQKAPSFEKPRNTLIVLRF